jgi:hypothetical protein
MSIIEKDLLSKKLVEIIYEFELYTQNGEHFWPPYAANRSLIQSDTVIRGLGKSSPDEIKESVDYIVSEYPTIDAQAIRKKLIDGSLANQKYNYKGIDCSGLVFYVYKKLYAELLGLDLVSILGVPKNQVLNGANNYDEWKNVYSLSAEEADSLPEQVPMKWVADTFARKPVNLCGVTSFVSPFSSQRISSMSEVTIGDLVHMRIPNDPISHIAAITALDNGLVTLAHSGRSNPEDIGGIAFETVPLSDHVETTALSTPREFLGVYRLKGL